MSSKKRTYGKLTFVMYFLNGVPFSIFVLIRGYCETLNLDGFPNATVLLFLSFKTNK